MRRKKTVAVAILLLGLLASGIAWAHGAVHGSIGFHGHFPGHHHHHHHHFHSGASVGVVLGTPWVWHGYYRPPPVYVYSPPIIVTPASSPVYIEKGIAAAPTEQASAYWYYCNNPQGYYPYVKACPAGWQPVPVQPPRP